MSYAAQHENTPDVSGAHRASHVGQDGILSTGGQRTGTPDIPGVHRVSYVGQDGILSYGGQRTGTPLDILGVYCTSRVGQDWQAPPVVVVQCRKSGFMSVHDDETIIETQ